MKVTICLLLAFVCTNIAHADLFAVECECRVSNLATGLSFNGEEISVVSGDYDGDHMFAADEFVDAWEFSALEADVPYGAGENGVLCVCSLNLRQDLQMVDII